MRSHNLRGLTKSTIASMYRALPRILKYQLLTRLLFAIILVPTFWLLTELIMANLGLNVITNSTLRQFLLTKEGFAVVLLGMVFLFLGIILEIFGFVTISARVIKNQKESTYRLLVWENLKKLPGFFRLGGLLLILYLLIFIPLSGSGITISFLRNIKIPNFITSVIESNPMYFGIYAALTIGMLLFSVRWIFTFHFMVIGGDPVDVAMRKSADLFRRNKKNLILAYTIVTLLGIALLLVLILLWFAGIAFLSSRLDLKTATGLGVMFGLFLIQTIGIFLATMLFVPFEIHFLTSIFYRLVEKDPHYESLYDRYPLFPERKKTKFIDRLFLKPARLIVLTLLVVVSISVLAGRFPDQFLPYQREIEIVAHRGGGFVAQENSMAGLQAAIKLGANYTEIDVQRTKDGHYILNHDQTFQRAAGMKARAEDLTLAEVEQLTLKPHPGILEPQKVPTLNAFLDEAKGRIRIFLELKGSTADEKMVDDTVAMIKEKNMQLDVVLVSLDYKIIQYIESKYADMLSGFIYFLSLGDIASLDGDYLILEEGTATKNNIQSIQMADKKVVVWTVNTEDSIRKFAASDVDAIITDEIEMVKDELIYRNSLSQRDKMLEMFLPK